MNPAEVRRSLTKGGKRWTVEKQLLEAKDKEGWRLVVELGHWQDGVQRVRLKKFQPSGKFYFCEGLTLSREAFVALMFATVGLPPIESLVEEIAIYIGKEKMGQWKVSDVQKALRGELGGEHDQDGV